jgi:putative transposase
MIACQELSPDVGTVAACKSLDIARPTFYRRFGARIEQPPAPRPAPPRALSAVERQEVLDVLHTDRFVDKAPTEVYAALLDEGIYHCSVRTMYRVLGKAGEIRERRNQARHPQYKAPELLATAPNQVWSWDITKLLGPVKWTCFYLYVILDLFGRYVVGWMLAHCERSSLAKRLIAETCEKQNVQPGQLTIHADRGSSMKSKPVALLMVDLGITKSHSRPYVSDDNPYSESQFKTMKYRPGFPDRFGSIQDARAFCQEFFPWYNGEHRHTGIGLMIPETVHYGKAERATSQRQIVLASAFNEHPERFVRGMPMPPPLPETAWINKPKVESKPVVLAENISIPGVLRYGSEGGRRSWVNMESDFSSQIAQQSGNDIKFELQVSHYYWHRGLSGLFSTSSQGFWWFGCILPFDPDTVQEPKRLCSRGWPSGFYAHCPIASYRRLLDCFQPMC